MSLNSEGREKYQCVLQRILKKFPEEDISESAIGWALKTAIFECVDIPESGDEKLSARVEKALGKLREFLEASPEEYECWVEVSGLDPSSLPEAFGAVRFVVFDEEQIHSIETKNAGDQQVKPVTIDRGLTKSLLDKTTAVVEVKARDRNAAEKLAKREVHTTLECMNFFSDLRPAGQKFLSVGRRPPSTSGRLIVSSSSEVPCMSKILNDEPATPFSLERLRSRADGKISEAINRTEELLKKRKTSEVEDLLLLSVCLVGRAGVKRMWEESFLMFIIALECLILPKRGTGLSGRLSKRAAWFLGNTSDKRKDIKKLIRKLYEIRSKIVHSGRYEVPEEKYNQAYQVARVSILKMLTNQDISGLSSLDKLDDWFEKLTLDA